MTSQTREALGLKLLVDRSTHRVLFAEACAAAVDFFSALLSVPVGTAVRLLLLQDDASAGSLGKLYASLRDLDPAFLLRPPAVSRDALFASADHLRSLSSVIGSSKPLSSAQQPAKTKSFFRCTGHNHSEYDYDDINRCWASQRYVSHAYGATCPDCKTSMTKEMIFVPGKAEPKAKRTLADDAARTGCATYMVMDNLVVKPMSTVSAIAMLDKLQTKDLSSLYELHVVLGMEEGLELLKASLCSKTVLTDVFLRKKHQGDVSSK